MIVLVDDVRVEFTMIFRIKDQVRVDDQMVRIGGP